MSDMPWVRFFPSDWLAGTRGMSAAETGIYITLVASMYERGEPIPEDHARLARLCGASNSTFKTALETLVFEGKVRRIDGGLWNDRVEKEGVYRSEKSEVGKQAANARWQKSQQNQQPLDANAMQSQCVGNANQKPEAREQIAEANASDAPSAVDARSVLWNDGLATLISISGLTNSGARSILGKWLKASRDDCALVISKITAARENRVGDPVAWITASLGPPGKTSPRAGVVGAAQRILESEKNGTESVFGDHGHAQFLPATRRDGRRDAAENLLGSPSGYRLPGNH